MCFNTPFWFLETASSGRLWNCSFWHFCVLSPLKKVLFFFINYLSSLCWSSSWVWLVYNFNKYVKLLEQKVVYFCKQLYLWTRFLFCIWLWLHPAALPLIQHVFAQLKGIFHWQITSSFQVFYTREFTRTCLHSLSNQIVRLEAVVSY